MKKSLVLITLCMPLVYTLRGTHYSPATQKRFFSELYAKIKPHISAAQETIATFSASLADEWICSHAHKNDVALVRFAEHDELCSDELAYLQKRLTHVRQHITKLVSPHTLRDRTPCIALCASGGGHRAMLFTLGFLKGLDDIGLLDCTTYMAGLSGSTWAMAGWIASQKKLDDFIPTLYKKLYQGLEGVKNPKLLYKLSKQLISKALHGQCMSMIDIWGPTLANTLLLDLKADRLDVTLSESHAHLAHANLPLPMYTAVTPNVEPYEWIEFTPFEVGSTFQQAYIPTWAYGRKFKNGTSVNFAGEQSLGYMMGVFGSAFTFDIEDAVRQTSQSINACIAQFPYSVQPTLHTIIDNLVNSPLDDVRIAPSSLPNFTYKAAACNLNDDKHLTLIDAGMSFNLPLPPLLRPARQVDIIVVCDASAPIAGCQTLHWAEEYMRMKNLKFPPIDYAQADTQTMSIFKDPHDATCPVVVYFPCIKNVTYSTSFDPATCAQSDYCSTLNFTYTTEQIQELMGLATYTVKQHAQELIALIEQCMQHSTI